MRIFRFAVFFLLSTLLLVMPLQAATVTQLASVPIPDGVTVANTLVYDQQGHLFLTAGYIWFPGFTSYRIASEYYKYDIATNTWSQVASSPAGTEHNAAIYDGKGHIVMNRGNWSSNFFSYDIESNTWSNKTRPPTPGNMAYNAAAFDNDKYAYFTGGMWSQRLYRYDTTNDTWLDIAELPEQMAYNTMIYDGNGNLFVNAGRHDSRGWSNAFYRYNIASDSWSRKANIPVVTGGNRAIYDGRDGIIMTGGYADGPRIYRYDITTDIWTRIAEAPDPLNESGVAFDGVGSVYFMGCETNRLWRYDLPAIPEPSSFLALLAGLGGISGLTTLRRRK